MTDTGVEQSINILEKGTYVSYNGIQLLFRLGNTSITSSGVIVNGSIEVTLSKEAKY